MKNKTDSKVDTRRNLLPVSFQGLGRHFRMEAGIDAMQPEKDENPLVFAELMRMQVERYHKIDASIASIQPEEGETPLLFAVRKPFSPIIIGRLIQNGADFHVKEKSGNTPLMLALDISYNNLNTVVLLLWYEEAGETPFIDPDFEQGRLALLLAVFTNSGDTVQALLAAGVDPNAVNKTGRTPLMLACQVGNVEAASILLSHGADVHGREAINDRLTALHFAASEYHAACVRVLLDHGAQVDVRDDQQATPLLKAAWGFPRAETMQILLEHGADVHAENREGQSPLELACFHGDEASIRMLLEWGAGTNPVYLRAAFEATVFDNNWDKALLLFEAGLPYGLSEAVRLRDRKQMKKLFAAGTTQAELDAAIAWAEGHYVWDITRALLKAGANVNTKDERGNTLFTSWIGVDCSENMWFRELRPLVPYGPDFNLLGETGKTVLMEAAHLGYTRLTRFVLKHGADVNLGDGEGCTPLMMAVVQGHTRLVRLLLEQGAIFNLQDTRGDTALSIALQQGQQNKQIIRLLKVAGATSPT